MTFQVKAIFDDGSSKIIQYSDSYDAALVCALAIADQRLTYAALLPLLKTIQLVSGDRVELDIRVEKRIIGRAQPAAERGGIASWNPPAAPSSPFSEEKRSPCDDALSGKLIRLSAYSRPASTLDMLARWEPSHPKEAGFYSGLDNPTRTVRVMGSGIWKEDHADLYFDQQKRIVDQARRRFGPLKVLFDVRNWVVESPQSALQFQDVNKALYRPEDRLVAVVRSATDKEPPRTALRGKNTEVFTSLNTAETWLHAAAGLS